MGKSDEKKLPIIDRFSRELIEKSRANSGFAIEKSSSGRRRRIARSRCTIIPNEDASNRLRMNLCNVNIIETLNAAYFFSFVEL